MKVGNVIIEQFGCMYIDIIRKNRYVGFINTYEREIRTKCDSDLNDYAVQPGCLCFYDHKMIREED